MSYSFAIKYFVFGRDKYSEIGPVPANVLGYFSNSLLPGNDPDFPKGEFRMEVSDLTEAQQAPQTGRDFAIVPVEIDFTEL